MQNLRKVINHLYNKEVDGTGLAVFRIAYSIVLLGEIIHLFYYRHLIFDEIPYVIPGEIDMAPAFIFWMFSVIAIMLGFYTKLATIINYILGVAIIGTISTFEYHMFYAYLGINTFLMFMPISRCISFDRLFVKLKYSNTKYRYQPPRTVSVLNYFLPIFVGVGLVYFDSLFHKLSSDFWLRGLGVWLPSVLPQTVYFDATPIMNIKWLVIGLGYLTLLFEASFLFIFWRKRWRFTYFVIGLGLHVGIFICYPIPFFALGVISIYLLLVPVSFWKKLFRKRGLKSDKLMTFYYDGECPLCTRTRITLEHFDTRNKVSFVTVQQGIQEDEHIKNVPLNTLLDDIHSVDTKGNVFNGLDTYIKVFNVIWYLKPLSWVLRFPGVYHLGKKSYKYIATNRTTERCTEENCGYTIPELPTKDNKMKILTNYTLADLKIAGITISIIFICALQVIAIYNSPLLNDLKVNLGTQDNKIINLTNKVGNGLTKLSKTYFGIAKHGVFLDVHFDQYNHSIGIVYKDKSKDIWLPLIEEDGKPGDYLIGHNWAKYSFRTNNPHINQEVLKKGIRDFTAFWAKKHGVSLDEVIFKVMVKKNEQPVNWEKDFLHKQLANPWIDAGTVQWKNKEFSADIAIIEDL